MRKKPHFTHGRDNLRGDVSGKRFNTHAMERNVADVAQERLSDGTGCTDTWHCNVGSVTGHCYRVPSQGTVTGYCHRTPITWYRHWITSQDTVTGYCHRTPITWYRHWITSQDTVTGHSHRAPVTGSTATNLCHG